MGRAVALGEVAFAGGVELGRAIDESEAFGVVESAEALEEVGEIDVRGHGGASEIGDRAVHDLEALDFGGGEPPRVRELG